MHLPVDHLVYATPDLDRGMMEIERLTGVTPTLGGRHPGRGTHNAVIALGDDAYLEIIAPDPEQPTPTSGRWLGVDGGRSSRLTTWAVKSSDLFNVRSRAVASGVPLGDVRSGQRQRADGVRLSWRVTDPDPLIADGVIPFLIDWGGSPHPSRSAARGASLVDLHLEHPDAARIERMLHALDVNVSVAATAEAAIVAVIEGLHGRVQLR